MSKNVTITLVEPIVGHTTIKEIVLRPPGLLEYAAIGDPAAMMRADNDVLQIVENDAAIARYVDCCIVEPADKLLLEQVGLEDAMAIKEAILDFFVKARTSRMERTAAAKKAA